MRSKTIKRFLKKWPGEKYFGIYRFLPFFFFLGAALEFSMINWNVGQVNFYRVYKRNEARRLAESLIETENS